MKVLNLSWLLVNLADVVGCVLSILVLRQKDGSRANQYLFWFFVGQVIESTIAAVSVVVLVVHPLPQDPAQWFAWARVSGRAVKVFFVWTFTLYMLNIIAPVVGHNGHIMKEVTEAVEPNGK